MKLIIYDKLVFLKEDTILYAMMNLIFLIIIF